MTITSNPASVVFGNRIHYQALQTVTSNDTTDPINTPAIPILGLDLKAVAFGYRATSAGANSTTAQMIVQGTIATDAQVSSGTATWMTLTNASGTSFQTSAATIGAATATVPVGRVTDSEALGIDAFPFTHLRGQLDQAGSTVGFTGELFALVQLEQTKY